MIILIYLILPWVVSFDRIQLVSAIMRYESMDNRIRYVHLASKSNYLYRIYIFSVQGGWNTLRGYYVLHKLYLRTKGEQSAKKKGGCNHLDVYTLLSRVYHGYIFVYYSWWDVGNGPLRQQEEWSNLVWETVFSTTLF